MASLHPHNHLGFPSTDEEAEAQKVTRPAQVQHGWERHFQVPTPADLGLALKTLPAPFS